MQVCLAEIHTNFLKSSCENFYPHNIAGGFRTIDNIRDALEGADSIN